jgi:hypothetical protein
MTPAPHGSRSAVAHRRSGRETSRELTTAFRRYVEAVQATDDPLHAHDAEAALTLAVEVMGHRRHSTVDAALVAEYGIAIRDLAAAVRDAGRRAAAHPGLLARAVVLARTLERTGAGRRAARTQRAMVAATAVAR